MLLTMARRETKRYSTGAEYLAVARLLMNGIVTFKAPEGTAGYDVIATAPEIGTSCRVQVKCRWGGRIDGFIVGNKFPACDFLVFGASHMSGGSAPVDAESNPHVYVFPAALLDPIVRDRDRMPKIQFNDLNAAAGAWPGASAGLASFKENWGQIRTHLGLPEVDTAANGLTELRTASL